MSFLFYRREKISLNTLITDDLLDQIKIYSGLQNDKSFSNAECISVHIECLKSICNLAFNSREVAERCCKSGILDGVLRRISRYK